MREHLKIGFAGGTYARRFYVADVQAEGAPMNGEINVALDAADFLVLFPLGNSGRARLIGALIMCHSDDKGLVCPPKLAPTVTTLPPARLSMYGSISSRR